MVPFKSICFHTATMAQVSNYATRSLRLYRLCGGFVRVRRRIRSHNRTQWCITGLYEYRISKKQRPDLGRGVVEGISNLIN